jgi:hypothetical protein
MDKELDYLLGKILELEEERIHFKSMLEFSDYDPIIKDCVGRVKSLESEIKILKNIYVILNK